MAKKRFTDRLAGSVVRSVQRGKKAKKPILSGLLDKAYKKR